MSGTIAHSDEPDWDEDKAARLLNSIVLVGITYVDSKDTPLEQVQFFGMISTVKRSERIAVDVHSETFRGQTRWLPPDTSAFVAADPGTYRLRSTGEEIVDPDYLASWTVVRPPDQPQ